MSSASDTTINKYNIVTIEYRVSDDSRGTLYIYDEDVDEHGSFICGGDTFIDILAYDIEEINRPLTDLTYQLQNLTSEPILLGLMNECEYSHAYISKSNDSIILTYVDENGVEPTLKHRIDNSVVAIRQLITAINNPVFDFD